MPKARHRYMPSSFTDPCVSLPDIANHTHTQLSLSLSFCVHAHNTQVTHIHPTPLHPATYRLKSKGQPDQLALLADAGLGMRWSLVVVDGQRLRQVLAFFNGIQVVCQSRGQVWNGKRKSIYTQCHVACRNYRSPDSAAAVSITAPDTERGSREPISK